jgi:hypothetical protein
VEDLFNRFASPLVQLSKNSGDKERALGISMILWLLLIAGTDTNENIYKDLEHVFRNDHDCKYMAISIYFIHMKATLSNAEVHKLQKHFKDPLNIIELELGFDHIMNETRTYATQLEDLNTID